MKRFISLGLLLLLSVVCASAQTVTTDTLITSAQSWSTPGYSISNGATLTIQGPDADVTNGRDGRIGSITPGHLVISAGGTFTHDNAYIAENSGYTGSATITGAGSTWTHTALFVGMMGSGSLILSDGASMSSTTGYFGAFSSSATGTGLIDGATWINTGSLNVGSSGTGTLTISGGSTVSSKNGWLGGNPSGTGSVLITGAGSTWSTSSNEDTSDIMIGDEGTGTLTLANGGTVAVNSGAGAINLGANDANAQGTLNIGAGSDAPAAAAGVLNAATVTVGSGTGTLQFNTTGTSAAPTYFTKDGMSSGAGIATSGNLSLVHTAGTTIMSGTLEHTGTTTINGGTLIIDGSVTSSAITVHSGGTLAGSGTIDGLATFQSGAHLAAGNSPGTLTFTNDLTLLGGTILDFELGTVSDLIRVSGGTLSGSTEAGGLTLNLFDSGGFTAGTYTLFDFTGASTSSFDLADFSIGSTMSGFDFGLSFAGNTLELTATAVPEPSTYAAIFGAAALGFAAWRRRRKIES